MTLIDLSKLTCLPGLVETHTHVLLQGDITAADYDEQILKQSVPFRTLLAARAARKSLEYGFTTIRDLETEGAGYADVDLKKAINQGITDGPRMQVAGRAMDVTGAYPVLGYAWELQPHMPKGVQEVDGVEGARKAVREQLSYGTDWIKVYSDRSYFLRPDGVLDDIPTFTLDELKAIVDEAHRQRHKVASHATALNGVHNSVVAGVDSIEHGDYIADEDLADDEAERHLLRADDLCGRVRGGGSRRRVAEDDRHQQRDGATGDEGRSEDRVRHRRGWILVGHQSGSAIQDNGWAGDDSGAGAEVGDVRMRRNCWAGATRSDR